MKTILRAIFHRIQIIVERLRGIDFTAEVDSSREYNIKYTASTPLINHVLRGYFLKKGISEQDSIIDVGCGKGRMIYFFSGFPFGNVGGVEYEEELYEICKKNLFSLKVYRINIYRADAANFTGYDEYNYFYLFNSFYGDIMKGFVQRLLDSKRRKDRDLRVLYFNPCEIDLFINNGFCIEEELPHKIVVLKL